MTKQAIANLIENTEIHVNKMLDLTRGHDSVHPDRSRCGGVGMCLMMMAEVEAEHELDEMLTAISRAGIHLSLGVK